MNPSLSKGQYLRVEAARQLVDQLNESNYMFVKEAVLAIFEDLLKGYDNARHASTQAEESASVFLAHDEYEVGGEG